MSSPLSVYSSAKQGPGEESTNPPTMILVYTSIKVTNITSLVVSFYIPMVLPFIITIRLDCILLGIVGKFPSVRSGWDSLNSECICAFLGLTASPYWLRVLFF